MTDRDLPPSNWGNDHPILHANDLERKSWALYSPDQQYRYRLRRVWGDGERLCYVMLNPSTATEISNDPTVERCERRARAYGYGGFEVVNIFALRSTDPKGLYSNEDPAGNGNDLAIKQSVNSCDAVLCAWGTHGALNGRGQEVLTLVRSTGKPLLTLGLTQAGHPKHPLYIGYAVKPSPWEF